MEIRRFMFWWVFGAAAIFQFLMALALGAFIFVTGMIALEHPGQQVWNLPDSVLWWIPWSAVILIGLLTVQLAGAVFHCLTDGWTTRAVRYVFTFALGMLAGLVFLVLVSILTGLGIVSALAVIFGMRQYSDVLFFLNTAAISWIFLMAALTWKCAEEDDPGLLAVLQFLGIRSLRRMLGWASLVCTAASGTLLLALLHPLFAVEVLAIYIVLFLMYWHDESPRTLNVILFHRRILRGIYNRANRRHSAIRIVWSTARA